MFLLKKISRFLVLLNVFFNLFSFVALNAQTVVPTPPNITPPSGGGAIDGGNNQNNNPPPSNTGGGTNPSDSKTVPPKSILCGGNTCPAIGAAGANQLAEKNGLAKFIIGIAQFLTFLAVALAVLFMVWGGFKYITSDGAEEAGRGKETLINAAIGLVIAIVAYTIVFLISSVVQGDFFGQFLG
jgi:Type IV secretion system pilin